MSDIKTVPALALADALPTIVFGELAQGTLNAAAAELRRQHALIAQMQREAVQPESRCMYPACNCFSPQGPQSCAHPAPHPEAQALDSQLQQPALHGYERDHKRALREVERASEHFPVLAGLSPENAINWLAFRLLCVQQQDDHAGSPAPATAKTLTEIRREWSAASGSPAASLTEIEKFDAYMRRNYPDAKGDGVFARAINALETMDTQLGMQFAPTAQSSKAALSDEEIVGIFYPIRTCSQNEASIAVAIGRAILARAGIGESRREPQGAASMSKITGEVLQELERAIRKFPTWPTDPLHALAVLGEEFGELTKDVLQLTYEPHKTSAANVRKEALQTAAMALRFAASLEAYEYRPGVQHAQQPRACIGETAPADPCPQCERGGVCRTPSCGRLKSSELMSLYGGITPQAGKESGE